MLKFRVAVAMSGGVDSSVSALLLQQQDYEVHGVFMKNWEDGYAPGYCSADEDLADAQDVCELLGIPLHKVNFSQAYQDRVFRYFLDEYRQGRTPNPDILCNKEIKFATFLHYAQQLGAEFIATGHYVRQLTGDGRHHLLKGADPHKDQSYFLATLTQKQLSKSLFPVGDLQKSQVRELASTAGLITHNKKGSTGICFIGERQFRQFLSHYLPAQPGEIHTPEGECIGQHMGVMFYTLGQRQGLGIGGRGGSSGEPWYVVDKQVQNNVIIVAQGQHHPLLYHQRLHASQLSWIGGEPPPIPLPCRAKTRYRQAEQACTIEILEKDQCQVFFHEPQRAMTPGQAVVFYSNDECLGGGIIDTAYD